MTQACSQVKCEKVKDFSSLASSGRSRVGGGRVLSILFDEEDELDMRDGTQKGYRLGMSHIGLLEL